MIVPLSIALAALALACVAVYGRHRRQLTVATEQVAAAREEIERAAARQHAMYRSIRSELEGPPAETIPLPTPEPSRAARPPQRRKRTPARRLSGPTDLPS